MSERKSEFRIEDVDRNLVVSTTITQPDLMWLDVRKAPFTVYGLLYGKEMAHFLRIHKVWPIRFPSVWRAVSIVRR